MEIKSLFCKYTHGKNRFLRTTTFKKPTISTLSTFTNRHWLTKSSQNSPPAEMKVGCSAEYKCIELTGQKGCFNEQFPPKLFTESAPTPIQS